MLQKSTAAAKVVIVVLLVLSLVGQVLVVPLMANETVRMFPMAASLWVPGIVGCVVLIACVQLTLLCTWRLLTLVDQGRIFQPVAWGPVTLMIGCALAVTILLATALLILTSANAISPGVLILLATGSIAGVGLTLLLVVLRDLLRQACRLEQDLRSSLTPMETLRNGDTAVRRRSPGRGRAAR